MASLQGAGTESALIGGLALAPYRVVRATQDIELLIPAERADDVQRELLAEAAQRETAFGTLRVVALEGLIAFKLQGLVNDPRRTQDLEYIRALTLNVYKKGSKVSRPSR